MPSNGSPLWGKARDLRGREGGCLAGCRRLDVTDFAGFVWALLVFFMPTWNAFVSGHVFRIQHDLWIRGLPLWSYSETLPSLWDSVFWSIRASSRSRSCTRRCSVYRIPGGYHLVPQHCSESKGKALVLHGSSQSGGGFSLLSSVQYLAYRPQQLIRGKGLLQERVGRVHR